MSRSPISLRSALLLGGVMLTLLSFLAAFTTIGAVLFLVGSVTFLIGLALYGRDRGMLG